MSIAPLPSCPIDVEGIKEFLPHRPPFLLLDQIVEYKLEETLVAKTHVDADDPVFKGHFPDLPLYPGVLTIEIMAQAACMLHSLYIHQQELESGSVLVPYLCIIKEARFMQAVHPGDTMIVQVNQVRRLGSLIQFKTEAKVNDALVASASLSSVSKLRKETDD